MALPEEEMTMSVSTLTLALLTGATLLLGAAAPASSQDVAQVELTPFQLTRVERFLETRAACLGCHQIGGKGGLIGPSLDGLAERVDRDYVVRMIADPAATLPGTRMPRQPMPAREVERLASYLMTRPRIAAGATSASVPEAPPGLAPDERFNGAALYARHCAACHGSEGRGDGWNASNLPVVPTVHADPEVMATRPDDTLFDGIFAGGFVLDKSARMPAFGQMLEPAQIRALVAHIRVLCDCEQPVWARGSR